MAFPPNWRKITVTDRPGGISWVNLDRIVRVMRTGDRTKVYLTDGSSFTTDAGLDDFIKNPGET